MFPFLPCLGFLFLGLKLAGCITWSWWLVLLPFYMLFAVMLVVILLTVFGAGVGLGARAVLQGRRVTPLRARR